jgi:hypothetical protein
MAGAGGGAVMVEGAEAIAVAGGGVIAVAASGVGEMGAGGARALPQPTQKRASLVFTEPHVPQVIMFTANTLRK